MRYMMLGLAMATNGLAGGGLVAQEAPSLATHYEVTTGDMVAAMLSEFLKLRVDFKDPALVTFELDPGVIDVEIFAAPPSRGSKTDEARKVIGTYWEFVQSALLPYVERRFNLKLGAEHFRIMYYDRNAPAESQLVLAFVQGSYVMP